MYEQWQDELPTARGFACATATRMRKQHLLGDMVGFAYEGMWLAARKYGPHVSVPFARWSAPFMRRAILDGLRSMGEIQRREHIYRKPEMLSLDYEAELSARDRDGLARLSVEPVDDYASRQWINHTLEPLPPRERDLMRMTLGDASCAEIAAAMGISPGRVTHLRNRAVERIRAAL